MKFERGILQHAGKAEGGERRTDCAQDHLLCCRAAHYQTADQDVLPRADHFAGRDVKLARGVHDGRRIIRLRPGEKFGEVVFAVGICVPGRPAELRIIDLGER